MVFTVKRFDSAVGTAIGAVLQWFRSTGHQARHAYARWLAEKLRDSLSDAQLEVAVNLLEDWLPPGEDPELGELVSVAETLE